MWDSSDVIRSRIFGTHLRAPFTTVVFHPRLSLTFLCCCIACVKMPDILANNVFGLLCHYSFCEEVPVVRMEGMHFFVQNTVC